jgi:DNA-binding PadR family transcriptional regulator
MKAIEAIFLERTNGHEVGEGFQGFYEYRYNTDPQKLLKSCIDKDLIEVAGVEKNMRFVKVADLKELLRLKSLKVSGKKEELINRLIENVSRNELEKHFSKKYYALTEKGSKYVSENEYAVFYHKYQNLSDEVTLKGFENAVMSSDDKPYYNIAIELLTKALVKRRKEKDWGLFRNVYLNMAGIHEWFDQDDLFIIKSIMVCVIDLSGLSNNNTYTPDFIFLAPGVINPLSDKIKKCEISDESIRGIIVDNIDALDLPKSFFSRDELIEMIMLALIDYENACEKIKNRIESSESRNKIGDSINGSTQNINSHKPKKKRSLLSRIFGSK